MQDKVVIAGSWYSKAVDNVNNVIAEHIIGRAVINKGTDRANDRSDGTQIKVANYANATLENTAVKTA